MGGAAGVLHRRRLVLGLPLSCRLLWLQTPDVGARLELRNELGVLVAFIASPSRLGGLRDGWSLLVLVLLVLMLLVLMLLVLLLLVLLLLVLLRSRPGEALAGLEEHLLLLQRVGDLGCLASEVEVFADTLLGGRAIAAERVIVEGVVAIVELPS
jgi:hypothetical protein